MIRWRVTLRTTVNPISAGRLDSVMVRCSNVEAGHLAVTPVIVHKLPDQIRGVAPAAVCGMPTDAADLGVAVGIKRSPAIAISSPPDRTP
jgi:hypothetical protein